jgi:hypothetical protein
MSFVGAFFPEKIYYGPGVTQKAALSTVAHEKWSVRQP